MSEKTQIKRNFKKDFDIFKKRKIIFFDNSASTLKPKVVCDAVDFYNRFESVNAGRGVYRLSYEVTSKVEKTRENLKKFFNASSFDVVFTKNTTESINLVALSFVSKILKKDDEILISRLEHNSNYLPWLALAEEKGAKLVFVELDNDFKITFENFKKAFTSKTKFVALNLVSNTLGSVTPCEKIIEFCHEKNVKVLIDGSQAVSHFKIDIDRLNPDFFAFSGYKMFAPTGVGGLIVKSKIANDIEPIFFGGGMVVDVFENEINLKDSPFKFEGGTLPISSIIGLGEAVGFIEKVSFDEILKNENDLKEYFIKKVKNIKGFTLYNSNPDLPIFLFNLENVHAHDAASMYDEFNITLRAGNHCALLVSSQLSTIATIRASLCFYNTKAEIDKFVFASKQIIKFFNS